MSLRNEFSGLAEYPAWEWTWQNCLGLSFNIVVLVALMWLFCKWIIWAANEDVKNDDW